MPIMQLHKGRRADIDGKQAGDVMLKSLFN